MTRSGTDDDGQSGPFSGGVKGAGAGAGQGTDNRDCPEVRKGPVASD